MHDGVSALPDLIFEDTFTRSPSSSYPGRLSSSRTPQACPYLLDPEFANLSAQNSLLYVSTDQLLVTQGSAQISPVQRGPTL